MFSAYLCAVVLCCDSVGTRSAKDVEVVQVSRKPRSHKQCIEDFGISVSAAGVVGLNGFTPRGAKVDIICPDSPAMRAGLKVGDVILDANGRDVNSWQCPFNQVEALGVALEARARGKGLKLLVSHGEDFSSPTETFTVRP